MDSTLAPRLSRAIRPSGRPTAGRLAGLDAVRFAAALMVVVSHVGPTHGLSFSLPEQFAAWGGNGVSLFFALSGYLLWRPFVTGQPSLRAYMLSRAGRILPAYWLACLVLVPIVGGNLLHFLVMSPDRDQPLGILWTLQAEVMFYVAVPFLARLRRPLAVPIAFGAASLILELIVAGTPAHATVVEAFLPVRFWAFAPGMILAAWNPRTSARWLVAGAAFLALGSAILPFTPGAGGGEFTDVPTVIGAGLIVGWAINASPRGAAFWSAGAAISYGLYLWHLDLFGLVGNAGIPLAFLVASASYVLFERPVMRWVKAMRVSAANPAASQPGLGVIGLSNESMRANDASVQRASATDVLPNEDFALGSQAGAA